MKNRTKKLIALFCSVLTAAGTFSVSALASEGPDGISVKDEINIAITSESSTYDIQKTTSSIPRGMLCGTVYE